jgi:hypothetical protein
MHQHMHAPHDPTRHRGDAEAVATRPRRRVARQIQPEARGHRTLSGPARQGATGQGRLQPRRRPRPSRRQSGKRSWDRLLQTHLAYCLIAGARRTRTACGAPGLVCPPAPRVRRRRRDVRVRRRRREQHAPEAGAEKGAGPAGTVPDGTVARQPPPPLRCAASTADTVGSRSQP